MLAAGASILRPRVAGGAGCTKTMLTWSPVV
jgi:hypothetical protein